MTQKNTYIALKTAAGKHNFSSGDELELDKKDAEELLKDSAIELVGAEKPAVKKDGK